MLKLLGINVDKWVIYAIGMILILASIGGTYWYWKHDIESAAQLTFDNQQLKKVLANQNEFIKQSKIITDAQTDQINQLTQKNRDVNKSLKDLNDYLNSADAAKADRPSSDILKRTIKGLQKVK